MIGVDLDLSKAFDMVVHEVMMLDKLFQYGVKGIAQDFLRDYLNNRSQYVECNHEFSEQLSNSHGVPRATFVPHQCERDK